MFHHFGRNECIFMSNVNKQIQALQLCLSVSCPAIFELSPAAPAAPNLHLWNVPLCICFTHTQKNVFSAEKHSFIHLWATKAGWGGSTSWLFCTQWDAAYSSVDPTTSALHEVHPGHANQITFTISVEPRWYRRGIGEVSGKPTPACCWTDQDKLVRGAV